MVPSEHTEYRPSDPANDRETKNKAIKVISIGCASIIVLLWLLFFVLNRIFLSTLGMPPDLAPSEVTGAPVITITGFDYRSDRNVVANLGVQGSYGIINYGLYKTDTQVSKRARLAKGTFEEIHVSATGRYVASQGVESFDSEDALIFIYDIKTKKRIAKLKAAGDLGDGFLWYPKTDTLIFTSARGLSVYRPKSGEQTLLAKEAPRVDSQLNPLWVSEGEDTVIYAIKKTKTGVIKQFDIDKSESKELTSVGSTLPGAGTVVGEDFYFLQDATGAYKLSKVNLVTGKKESVDKSAKSLSDDTVYVSSIRTLVYAKKHNSLIYSYYFGSVDSEPEESNSVRVLTLDLQEKKKRQLFSSVIDWAYSEKEDLFVWVDSLDSVTMEERKLSKLLKGDDLNP